MRNQARQTKGDRRDPNEGRQAGKGNPPAVSPPHSLTPSLPLLFALLVAALTLPAMWPFLASTEYWVSHDGLFHLYRLLSLESSWRTGHLYPRLFPDFAFGYGFAVLNFYGPLTYYVALVLRLLGLPALVAMKGTFALSYPLAALAAWWLARDLWRQPDDAPNEAAGLIAALTYTYLPYHMADVQLRGALAESWAFVWWPLLFWAARRVRPWPFALFLAALILTHNLSVVLVAMPLGFWVLGSGFWGTAGEGRRTKEEEPKADNLGWEGSESVAVSSPLPLSPSPPLLLSVVVGTLMALGLTAFYWLPVALESRYVAIAQDVGGLGFERHLASMTQWLAAGPVYRYFPEQGVAGEHPLSWAQVALLGVALLGLPRLWRGPQRWPALFWWLTLALTLFLLTPLSAGLWRTFVFPFGLVQYPWRWLGLTSLATAMVVSSLVVAWRGGRARTVTLLGLALLLGGLAFSSMQHLPWQARAVDVARHPMPMWEEDAANGQVGATWTAEFLPRTVQEQRWALARAPETVEGVGSRTPLRVTSLRGGSTHFSVAVTAEEAGWLTFPRFAYPSMQATVDGVVQSVVPRGALGLAGVQVPAGSHRVELLPQPLSNNPWLRFGLTILAWVIGLFGVWRWQRWGIFPIGFWMLAVAFAPDNVPRYSPPSEVSQPLTFGEQAQLLSYRRPSSISPGDTLPVMLTWFNLVQTEQGYSTFVHLTPRGGGAPVAQHDGPPNMGTVPTQRWLPGQLVQDLHLLPLPPDLPPGDYALWAGLYATQNNTAAPLAGDSGAPRLLGVLSITE